MKKALREPSRIFSTLLQQLSSSAGFWWLLGKKIQNNCNWKGLRIFYPDCFLCVCLCVVGAMLARTAHEFGPYSVLFHKVDERRPLDLHWLSVTVVHGKHKVEKVGFPEVRWGLFFKVGPSQPNTTVGGRERRGEKVFKQLQHRTSAGAELSLPFQAKKNRITG